MIARRLIVTGRVQGVFYRSWAVEHARSLGITGWVRNLLSGEVEILAMGEPASVQALIDLCWTGPRTAKVEDVTVQEVRAEPLQGFDRRPSA